MRMYDNDRPRQKRGGSFLIALLIAAFAFFMYFTQTEINPITGEKQQVALTTDQEIKLGLQSAPKMAAQMGGEISSKDPRFQEVQRIGKLILSKTQAKKGPWQFKFHLLADDKMINAFALPGGQIFITLGLLNKLQTEGQLAGVLAHEMGHVIQRHSAQQMAKGQLGQLLVMATGIGADNESNRGYQAAMIASVVNQMSQLRYGRKDELEADQWGLKLMEETGYHPSAMIEVMKILEKASSEIHQPEFLLTHPYPEHRIKMITTYLKKHPPSPHLTEGRKLKDIFYQPRIF
ncbi:M48 family metalloprotease [Candidatus Protochlamydia sp. W-9]|uniref:M48 family metalloprotease n=1 Tax=Candidatus Protochlamydia sp. W-9 TaxID=1785087 RepID=UPI00096A9B30|nr:M48 family metalloprotease [Candidatus Protochlamydia sp. W-9]